MSGEIQIAVSTHPTEVEERVRQAILNIFPDAVIEVMDSGLEASASDLEEFITKIRNQKIRNTARSLLLKSIGDDCLVFRLNKQAAFAGKINFTEGDSPLGDIEVKIKTDEPDALIDTLTRIKEAEE